MKDLLRAVFADALDALAQRVRWWTPRCTGAAAQCIEGGGDVVVVAFGKAARTMATAWLSAPLPHGPQRGLLVPAAGDDAPLPPFEVIPGGHPLPNEGSFRAAARALELCRGAGPRDHIAFLVSGGGSAMLELPIDPAVAVDEWRGFYLALLGSGAPIEHVNRIRRRLSAIKGGRLALAGARARSQTTVVVRDVAGPVEDVASGPTASFEPEPDRLLDDLREAGCLDALPAPLRTAVERGRVPPLPPLPEPLSRFAWITVLSEDDLARAATAALTARDVQVAVADDVDDLPVADATARLLARLESLHRAHPGRPVAVVATGELSVPLPAAAGTGGRNQQFALHCATRIAGQPITVLSCGTDGIDGNSPAAGALVDGATVARAAALGRDTADALRRCDAFPLLHALGDAVVTGPTGTNVRDLRVLVHGG